MTQPSNDAELTHVNKSLDDIGSDATGNAPSQKTVSDPEPNKVYVPLTWDVDNAVLCHRQGTTRLWGTCGECCVTNTLNLVTGSAYTEADTVEYVLQEGLCDPETGGMSLNNIVDFYDRRLPENMDVFGYGGSYAPTLDEMARKIESGKILNVSVYGEMMREGGHTEEGEVYSTHWLVLHSVQRDANGNLEGFGIVDSASNATYIDVDTLSNIYYGHNGTVILDPCCVQIYGWRYADWGEK